MDKSIAQRIAQDLHLSPRELEQRKNFLEIGPDDTRLIKAFAAAMGPVPSDVFDAFYQHLLAFPETAPILRDQTTVEKLKELQTAHLQRLLSGKYDQDYLLDRLAVGWRHTELGIVPLWYIGSYDKYLEAIKNLTQRYAEQPARVFASLFKVILLDMILTLEAYHYGKYRLQEELKRAVVTDELTGVFNRRKVDEMLAFEMDRARRSKAPLTVLMLDIDHFKKVNDTFGHQAGDEVLRQLATLVSSSLRQDDYLIRLGGEEFGAFLPNTPLDRALVAAERIRHRVGEEVFGAVGQVTVSLGAAVLEPHDTKQTFLQRADAKLYEAKRKGRNCVCS